MLYQSFISALVVFTTVVAALPSVHVSDSSFSLSRRGKKDDSCIECPPDTTECKDGCLYIICDKTKCQDEACCEKKGLEDGKPYVPPSIYTSDVSFSTMAFHFLPFPMFRFQFIRHQVSIRRLHIVPAMRCSSTSIVLPMLSSSLLTTMTNFLSPLERRVLRRNSISVLGPVKFKSTLAIVRTSLSAMTLGH
jgi:hypothetical protein